MFNPKDFLNIAKQLAQGNTEAHFRSAINRTYYATFGLLVTKLDFKDDTLSVHHNLINHLKKSENRNKYKAGQKLDLLHKKRKDCDYRYNLSSPIAQSSTEYQLNEAKEIIELITIADQED